MRESLVVCQEIVEVGRKANSPVTSKYKESLAIILHIDCTKVL